MRRWKAKGLPICRLLSLVIGIFALSGCARYPATYTQDAELPALHHLDWGVPFFWDALWSPDGRYIAGFAGEDAATSHLEVVTPDGRERHDLSVDPNNWRCGYSFEATIAWRPDGRLTCISMGKIPDGYHLCTGAAPFAECSLVPLATKVKYGDGAAWLPDGSTLLLTASTLFPDTTFSRYDNLHIITADGKVTQTIEFPNGGIFLPTWVPHAPTLTLSYLLGAPRNSDGVPAAPYRLVASTVSGDSAEHVTLGPPQALVTDPQLDEGGYAWSPSGRWIAVRHGNYQGGDKIYLVDAHDPSQTADVVLADKTGIQMMDPIWSPDGKTLIVFTVQLGVNQPYAIDIASYLASKALEP